ncbi:glycosyltransferase family 4 protein [Bacteroidota bacterium]
MAQQKYKIVINGKLPPPYMGPAIATQVLLNSDLKNRFNLIHFDNTINKTINTQGKAELGKVLKTLGLYLSFLKLLRNEKPDLVLIPISQTTVGFLKDAPYVFLAKWFSKHTLIQLRGSNLKNWLNSSSQFVKTFFRTAIKGTDGAIVLGQNLKHLFKDYYPNENIYVAPNGANYQFSDEVLERVDDRLRVLYLANLLESKGVELVLDAAIKSGGGDMVFQFVGGWNGETPFKKRFLSKLENCKDWVSVHPPVSGNDKLNKLQEADVFVFPPIMPEGHPWVLVEAMAAGLPIIATDQGAIVETLKDGINGFVVGKDNSDEIVEKLNQLRRDPTLRGKMAHNSRKIYEEKLTEAQMVKNYVSIFHSVIT